MGQAKRRGTYEDRVAQAKARDAEKAKQRWEEHQQWLKDHPPKQTQPIRRTSPLLTVALAAAICGGMRR